MSRVNKKLIIESERGNNYLVNQKIPQVLLLHPVLNYLMQLSEKGINIEEWVKKLGTEEVEIEALREPHLYKLAIRSRMSFCLKPGGIQCVNLSRHRSNRPIGLLILRVAKIAA